MGFILRGPTMHGRASSVVITNVLLVPWLWAMLGCGLVHGQSAAPTVPLATHGHVFFRVQVTPSAGTPLSGRLLIFVKQGAGDKEVDTTEFHFADTWVAAREVSNLVPGGTVDVDGDEVAYPKGLSALPAGKFEAQAVLDVDHSYNYSGRGPQDWIGDAVSLGDWSPSSGSMPVLTLDHHPPQDMKRSAGRLAMLADAKLVGAQEEDFTSPILSNFWGHPVIIKAWVIVPPGYVDKRSEKYPTAYWTHGFGGGIDGALSRGLDIRKRMNAGKMPPMIWVMLDESVPQGTHEFADSVNTGPWGAALTTEFIPYLERKYRMDAKPSGRLLNGHSSGGWATLQLQVNYPEVFGGTWSTSPDSSDFHDFTGPDLYAPNANVYFKPDGLPYPIMRDKGKVIATLEQFGKLETVLGAYGGQFGSFDWVFSPKGDNGAPKPMFDRKTGQVDPQVVAYWHDHYDLSYLVEKNWTARGAELKGRIHVIVGTADTFYLDGAAHKFEGVLAKLGGDPHFTYLPDRTHFDLYGVGDDKLGLFDQIGQEMYAVARPKFQ
jgi:hypothetical protein